MKNRTFCVIATVLLFCMVSFAQPPPPSIADQIRAQIQAILTADNGTDFVRLKQLVVQQLTLSGVPISDQIVNEEVAKYIAAKLNVPVPTRVPVGTAPSAMVSRPDDVLGPIDFGAGIGIMSDFGSNKRVKNATIDNNGIVRIEEESSLTPQVMLEAHIPYRFTKTQGFLSEIEVGPYIGILPGGDNIIKGIGGGVMIGFRRLQPNEEVAKDGKPLRTQAGAIRIGVGVMVEPKVQVLAEGIEENEMLSAGDTLRYRNKDAVGLQILVSFGL